MARKPNILFMIADDHRGQAIGALGIEPVRTPVMDGLIERGVHFAQARHTGSCSPAVSVPARTSLHAGIPAPIATPPAADYQTAMTLRPEWVTLGQAFRKAGYDTFATGKWHNDRASLNRSFTAARCVFFGGMCDHDKTPVQDYDPSGEYPTERMRVGEKFSSELFADAAIDYLHRREGDRPFFLYLAFTSPHDPRMAPPPFAEMYDPGTAGKTLPLPPNFLPQHPFDQGDYRIRDEVLAGFPRGESEVLRHLADYYAMISHQDHHMGRVLAALRDTGHTDDTLVIYTGDHGLAVGQHGLLGKQNMYEHSVRVPMILAGPGLPRGDAIDALVHTMDLYPTLCELAGIEVPASVQARSLLPLLQDRRRTLRAHVGCFYRYYQRMITDGRWKLIRYTAHEGSGTDRTQLFDLAADPWEMTDLSGSAEHRERQAALEAALDAWP